MASVVNDSVETRNNVTVNLQVKDSAGLVSQIGDNIIINTINANDQKAVVFKWTPQLAGAHEVIVTVDSDDTILESDETNNIITKAVNVTQRALSSAIVLAKDTFSENESMAISLVISNQGNVPENINYTLTVEDLNGSVFETVTQSLLSLEPYALQEVNLTWNTGTILTGDNKLHVTITDSTTGELLTESTKSFTIQPTPSVSEPSNTETITVAGDPSAPDSIIRRGDRYVTTIVEDITSNQALTRKPLLMS